MNEQELIEMYSGVPNSLVETTSGISPIWHIDIDNLTKGQETLKKAILKYIADEVDSNYGQSKTLYEADALCIVDAIADCIKTVYNK